MSSKTIRREPIEIRRGDVLWIACDPSIGVKPRKIRTCVAVSNNLANRYGQPLTVIPTSRYTAERAARAYMVDLRAPQSTIAEPRMANAAMIMTYDRRRVVKRAGRIAAAAQRALDAALAIHLDLALAESPSAEWV